MLAACKLLDAVLGCNIESFFVYEWMFVSASVPAAPAQHDTEASAALFDRLAHQIDAGATKPEAREAPASAGPFQLAGVRRITRLAELRGFFRSAAARVQAARLSGAAAVDEALLNDDIAVDLLAWPGHGRLLA